MSAALPSSPPRPTLVYLVEGLTCLGTNLLLLGIFFYTKERLGWGLMQNFLLATGQGAVYVVGSLSAHGLTVRLGRRNALVGVYSTMAVLALVAWFCISSGPGLVALL